jgi:hypothetical protein
MANSTPYDHTMPPPSPQINIQLQTPQYYCAVTKSQAIVDYRPAAAYPHTPRPVARDALYHALTRSSTFSPRSKPTLTAPKPRKDYYPPGLETLTRRVQAYHKQVLQQEHDQDSTFKKEKSKTSTSPSRRRSLTQGVQAYCKEVLRREQEQESFQGAAPSTLTASNTNNMPPPESPPMSKASPMAKPLSWASIIRKKRRSNEIFNINFSFSGPSRRHPADHTPPISPRTSMSSDAGSFSPTTTFETPEPLKRQKRIKSSSFGSPLIVPSATHNTHGYNLGPAPTGPANIWFEEDITRPVPIATRTEAHPGCLVDFTSTCDFSAALCPTDEETYHTYLNDSRRRSSDVIFPLDLDIDISLAEESRLETETRLRDFSASVPGRKRTCTFDRIDSVSCAPPSLSSSASTRFSDASTTWRTDASMDRFLTHVRASQVARAALKMQRCNDVFVDEADRGWLGDEPL